MASIFPVSHFGIVHFYLSNDTSLSDEKKNIFDRRIYVCEYTYINPVKMFRSVDFPAPLGPMMAVISPDLNSPDTDLRISLDSVMREIIFIIFRYSFDVGM